MQWSAHLTYKRYLAARAVSMPPIIYIYLIGLVVLLGITNSGGSTVFWVVYTTIFLIVLAGTFCLSIWLTLRRMRRLTGVAVLNYQIADGTITLSAGKDVVALSLGDFTLSRQGQDFLTLKRKKTLFGVLVLMFDNRQALERARALLTTHVT